MFLFKTFPYIFYMIHLHFPPAPFNNFSYFLLFLLFLKYPPIIFFTPSIKWPFTTSTIPYTISILTAPPVILAIPRNGIL